MPVVNGTNGNDFIHRSGDGRSVPVGYADVTGVTTGDDTLYGFAGDDFLFGDGGNDRLNGGVGADTMEGGAGNDWYFVDQADDAIIEAAGGGLDRILSSINYVLGAGIAVEMITSTNLAGTSALNLTGNEFGQTIAGNAGANILNGRGGADTLIGYGGNDWYFVDTAADRVIEGSGGGSDRILSSVHYVLAAGNSIEILTTTNTAGTTTINLTGNAFVQTIQGNAGANVLIGGGGADTLVGFGGDDTYYVDSADDIVIEGVDGGGYDTILTSAHYSLADRDYVELLATTDRFGTTAINLTGTWFTRTIEGNDGPNVIDGGRGENRMVGHGGDDIYYADDSFDVVSEAAGGGFDTVYVTSRTYFQLRVGVEVEVISVLDSTTLDSVSLYGSYSVQTLTGSAGFNILDGRGGADTMIGYGDRDWYYVDNAGDQVIEGSGGGSDRIFSSVDYVLDAAAQVETLTTTDGEAIDALNLTGNDFSQHILGNAGANALAGSGGNDTLDGGAGLDTLIGGGGSDRFLFNTSLNGSSNVDTIADFSVLDDSITLDRSFFTNLPSGGTLTLAAFHTGTAAHDADDRIIYDSATGNIYYDADGDSAGARVLFAQVNAGLALTNADFQLVA